MKDTDSPRLSLASTAIKSGWCNILLYRVDGPPNAIPRLASGGIQVDARIFSVHAILDG